MLTSFLSKCKLSPSSDVALVNVKLLIACAVSPVNYSETHPYGDLFSHWEKSPDSLRYASHSPPSSQTHSKTSPFLHWGVSCIRERMRLPLFLYEPDFERTICIRFRLCTEADVTKTSGISCVLGLTTISNHSESPQTFWVALTSSSVTIISFAPHNDK